MADPARTWALLVGIDVYDHGDQLIPLRGAAADAAAACAWLLAQGVPKEQILMRVSPREESKALVAALGLPAANVGDATFTSVTKGLASINRQDGDRLYVFLAGHGIYEPTAGRMFLCQDFGDFPPPDPAPTCNLSIDRLAKLLLSLSFPEQFLFLDGCQNLPYPDSVRQKFESGLSTVNVTPRERANGLVMAFSARPQELARERDGRGAFLGALLPALAPGTFRTDPLPPGLDAAVQLDFETGDRLVYLDPIVAWAREEIQALGETQTPYTECKGNALEAAPPLFRLPAEHTSEVVLDIHPGGAGENVAQLAVTSVTPPARRSRRRAGGKPITFPDRFRLPVGTQVMILCTPSKPEPRLRAGRLDLTATADSYTLAFEFEQLAEAVDEPAPRPPAPPPPAPGLTRPAIVSDLRVGMTRADGSDAFEMDGGLYRSLQREIGPFAGDDDDIEIEHHESGPVFHVHSDADDRQQRAIQMADEWSRRIASRLRDRGVVTSAPSISPVARSAGIFLRFAKAGPEGLAGPLAGEPVLTLTPVGGDPEDVRRLSLTEVFGRPVSAEPGPWQVSLDLPWGSWSRVVNVPFSGVLTVDLPDSAGLPPLRLAWARHAGVHGRVVFGAKKQGRGPLEGFGFDVISTRAELKKAGLPLDAGAVLVAKPEAQEVGVRVGDTHITFPLYRDRNFAVSLDGPRPRVEPLSDVRSPEWDLLVGAGRLDALTEEQAVALTNQKWFDDLLGLAGAYAIYARAERGTTAAPKYLDIVLGNLRDIVGHSSPDWQLLDIFRESSPAGPLSVESSQRLGAIAFERPTPLFRWGVPLALSLLDRARGPVDGGWRARLAMLDRGLLPGSAWTAYEQPG